LIRRRLRPRRGCIEMLFDAFGPFDFPRLRGDGERWRTVFWNEVEDAWTGLSEAVGCYVFVLEHGHNKVPWYVGMTMAQGGFRAEIFQQHKLDHYTEILLRRGTPKILLFPLVTNGRSWRLSNSVKSSKSSILWLEKTLIGMALSQNPEIRNMRDTKHLKNVYLNGVLGEQFQGRPTGPASYARKVFRG
jgi:hypothetical protein